MATSVKGNNPKCRGCGIAIEKTESRIIHKFEEKSNHLWATEHSYHCRVECVKGMKKSALKELTEKKWAEKEMIKLVETLNKV